MCWCAMHRPSAPLTNICSCSCLTFRAAAAVSLFLLSVQPFNTQRPFDMHRVKSFEMKSHNYYYYPVAENEGKKCAGMCKQTVHIEVTMSEAFFMHDYPFDRQIIELGVTLRRGWTSLKNSPDWNDTGSVLSTNL